MFVLQNIDIFLGSLHLKPYLTLELRNLLDHRISDPWVLSGVDFLISDPA